MTAALAATLLLSSALPEALTRGSAVDVSALNDGPAGSHGFVTARNGIFVESGSGRRIRFFATTLGTRAALPSKEDADAVARRLAQLGINLVRLRDADPARLEDLDYLVHALKSQGIYVNLDLGTARALGQKDYARLLLDRTNRFTGLAYRDEPALAFVEIRSPNNRATETPPEWRAEEWAEYRMATERAHAEEMSRFLASLGLHANIVDRQIEWDRPPSGRALAVPLVNEMEDPQGRLGALALERVEGRPFTVSPDDLPAPSGYDAERMPLLSTFALLQDWDAIYSDDALDPATEALSPSAALVFRKGLLLPLTATETVTLPERPWRQARSVADAWRQTGEPPDALSRRTAVALERGEGIRRHSAGSPVPIAIMARNTKGAVYRIDSPPAKVLAGFLGGERFALSGLTISFPDVGRNGEAFGALTLLDLAGRDLRTTRRALLTLVGGIPCVVSMPTERRLRVFPLDTSGTRMPPLPLIRREERLTFRVGPEAKAVWYEISDR